MIGESAPDALTAAHSFHYVSDIPAPPEPYVAHPYTLLQTKRLIGRKPELNLLTAWVAQPHKLNYARIFCVVALGGVGKSALTWEFFQNVVPHEMKPLAGRIWWSFYESDASFENFVIRALAYVSEHDRETVTKLSPPEREAQLLAHLAAKPYLVVLDGLERMLIAYARMDAAHLSDDEYDQQTANFVVGASGLPASAAQSFVGQHRLRFAADLRVGQFLRKLANIKETGSKILVSTRLYPADLQLKNREPMHGCFALFLPGLSNDDALKLWRTNGASGSQQALIPLFNRFGNHPLLIQALAGEVAANPGAPGDFDHWKAKRPDFNPFQFEHLVQVKTHVLEHALRGLEPDLRQVLHALAAFRMPASYDTLVALLVRSDENAVSTDEDLDDDLDEDLDDDASAPERKEVAKSDTRPFADQLVLDRALTALADRGLLGRDNRPGANRFDLHPIVRGVVWRGLDPEAQKDLFSTLHDHFWSFPVINYDQVNSLDDLTPAIEIYHTLIGLESFHEAFAFFKYRLKNATLFRLSANQQRAELLERLFPDGLDAPSSLGGKSDQSNALNELALSYQFSGQPGAAVPILRRSADLAEQEHDQLNLAVRLLNLSDAERLSGGVRAAEVSTQGALAISRDQGERVLEGTDLHRLGLVLAVRGESDDLVALQRSLRIWTDREHQQCEGLVNGFLAQRALLRGDPATARMLADRAWSLAAVHRVEADFIRAARLQGTAAVFLGEFVTADERLHHALTRARACNLVEQELPTLIALAELHCRRGEPERAREVLDDVWEAAERGPYPLFHADASNVLAQIERDAGRRDEAVAAATAAYRLAWCDGPPFAYHWGLVAAQAHLEALGATPPALPPFDESKHQPMPEVEIDPPDEYGDPARKA